MSDSTNQVWREIQGQGKHHLVLLHGWGLNAEVWRNIVPLLGAHFTLHLLDLPGFGRSNGFGAMPLAQMASHVAAAAPKPALWLGWSLGGLVASQVALAHPQQVQALITVASSPCFVRQTGWPGIKPQLLLDFRQQLKQDFANTIAQFLMLQTLGSENARFDARQLKQALLTLTPPSAAALDGGLEILQSSDLRQSLSQLARPLFRLYGRLDALVPHSIKALLDAQWPASQSLLFDRAAHTPFLSQPQEFCQALFDITQSL